MVGVRGQLLLQARSKESLSGPGGVPDSTRGTGVKERLGLAPPNGGSDQDSESTQHEPQVPSSG